MNDVTKIFIMKHLHTLLFLGIAIVLAGIFYAVLSVVLSVLGN